MIVTLSAWLGLWFFLSQPAWGLDGARRWFFEYLYVFLALIVVWRMSHVPTQKYYGLLSVRGKMLLLSGLVLITVIELLLQFPFGQAGHFFLNLSIIGWTLAFLVFALAAVLQLGKICAPALTCSVGRPAQAVAASEGQKKIDLWPIFIAIFVIIGRMVYLLIRKPGEVESPVVVILGGAILLLISLRSVLTQMTNFRLARQLGEFNRNLDAQIVRRTSELEQMNASLLEENHLRMETIEILARAETRFRILVEQSKGVHYQYEINQDLSIGASVYISPQIKAFACGSKDEWIGDIAQWAETVHPEDLGRVKRAAEQGIMNHTPYLADYRMLAADGAYRWVRDSAQCVGGPGSSNYWWQGLLLDITADVESRAREREHAALLEQISDAIISTDIQGRILTWNLSAVALYGWNEYEVVGRQLAEILQETTATGLELLPGEVIQRRRDGSRIPILPSKGLIRSSEGECVGSVMVNRNLTTMKSLSSLNSLYNESARDITIIVRLSDGKILHANQEAEREYGYSGEELLTLNITDLRSPKTHPQIATQMSLASSGGTLFETIHRRNNGSDFPVEVISHGANYEGQPCNFSTIRNISTRRAAEKTAVKTQNLLESIFTSLYEGVIVVVDDKIQLINPACESILGYSSAELIGNSVDLFYSLAEDETEFKQKIYQAIDEIGYCYAETHMMCHNGQTITVEIAVTELMEDYEHEIGLVISVHDLTARNKAQDALYFSEARYEALFHSISEGIVLLGHHPGEVDLNGVRVVDANPAMTRLLGMPVEQLSQRKLLDLFPDDENVWAERYSRVALGGETLRFEQHFNNLQMDVAFTAFSPEPGKFALLLSDVTDQRRNERMTTLQAARLKDLSRHLIEVQEEERRHLGRELHDEIGQVLTGLKFIIEASLTQPITASGETRLGSAIEIVNLLMGQVRDISFRLRPSILDDFGLVPALVWLCDRNRQYFGLEVELEHSGLEYRLPEEIETGAYRIVQEALTNVVRHAGTLQSSVRVWRNETGLEIEIFDLGKGFVLDQVIHTGKSFGLSGIAERANLLGGQTQFDSSPGTGTRIMAYLPIETRLEGKNL